MVMSDAQTHSRTPSSSGVQPNLDTSQPPATSSTTRKTPISVSPSGCFATDRILKSGYVHKRTQKTKTWRTIYIVLRPTTLSIYKSDKEEKLRRKIDLADLTAVTLLKDPKGKRQHLFGLFSLSRNYYLQAPTEKDAAEWVELIRSEARIDEEEEELFLASPPVRQGSFLQAGNFASGSLSATEGRSPVARAVPDRWVSSSPEPMELPSRTSLKPPSAGRRMSQIDSSGLSGAEFATHSDFSDWEPTRPGIKGTSFESLGALHPVPEGEGPDAVPAGPKRSSTGPHPDPSEADRVIWQGYMYLLRTPAPGVKQWKKAWAVLRPRNLILYKDSAESSVLFVLYMGAIVNVVETDPLSKKKRHCLQIITDEKNYRFCCRDEEELVQCLGGFKSLLAKRREIEKGRAAAGQAGGSGNGSGRSSAGGESSRGGRQGTGGGGGLMNVATAIVMANAAATATGAASAITVGEGKSGGEWSSGGLASSSSS